MSDILDFSEDEEVLLRPAPRLAHIINLGVDWERGIIHVGEQIGEDTGTWFWTLLDHFADRRVQVHVNTPGGDVTSMFAMHDAIRRHGNVVTIGYGQVCSAGVLLLACGHERYVTESCLLMSHEATGFGGDLGYRAAKDRRKAEDWQHLYWCELMSRYTPPEKDKAWWKRTTDRQAEYWLLGGEEIVAAGLADAVIRTGK